MARNKEDKNVWVLVLILLAGIVIGGFVGHLTSDIPWLAWLSYGQEFGVVSETGSAIQINVGMIVLLVGLKIKITVSSVIGVVIGALIYYKL